DRTRPMQRFTLLVVLHRFLDILEIEPVMVREQLVFRTDDRQLGVRRYILHALVIPFQPFAPELAAELRQGDRRIDPFQEKYIDQLKNEKEKKDALDHSPYSGNQSFGVDGHPLILRLQYTNCPRNTCTKVALYRLSVEICIYCNLNRPP